MARYIFAGDVHLSSRNGPDDPFFTALETWRRERIDGLFILGDLFNYWLGPEQAEYRECQQVLGLLKGMVEAGIPVYFFYGNRDYLVRKYLEKTWKILTPGDRAFFNLDGRLVYLTHGDTFLTNDKSYQILRRILRFPVTFHGAFIFPGIIRRTIAKKLRENSRKETSKRPQRTFVIDYNQVLREMGTAEVTICGHVHQAQKLAIDTSKGQKILFTLGDWSQGPSYIELRDGEFSIRTSL